MELANDISVWYVCVGSVSMGVWRMFDDSPISSGATVYIYHANKTMFSST